MYGQVAIKLHFNNLPAIIITLLLGAPIKNTVHVEKFTVAVRKGHTRVKRLLSFVLFFVMDLSQTRSEVPKRLVKKINNNNNLSIRERERETEKRTIKLI